MITVKLYRGHVTKIVEATEVSVYPSGRAEGSDQDPKLRTNRVRGIEIKIYSGHECFVIADSETEVSNSHLAMASEFWNGAYIENAHGATTETVRPY